MTSDVTRDVARDDAAAPAGGRAGRSAGRREAIGAVLGLALVALVAGLPVWLRTAGTTALQGDVAVTVTGSEAAPGVPAAALVLLAAGLAIGLAGRIGRWVVVATVLLAGVLLTASALAVVTDPAPVARTAAAEATGVQTLAAPVSLTPWPWVATGVGVLVVLVSGWLAVTSRRWARPSVRHDVPRGGPGPAVTATRPATPPGTDSDTTPATTPGAVPPAGGDAGATRAPGGVVPAADAAPDDDRATWDALTRGDDPT